ncbi:DUF6197 family protein [Streptomyces albus]|uniref:DUF6197 family protein n=1 Tax=Streptomyces albus TaxID=1888 RepID=UPI0024E08BEE|nr:hypothetical protein [Streptomyces albus]GHJ19165.1 hypothetical protein TPA0909_07790 [Streptomyces albus]
MPTTDHAPHRAPAASTAPALDLEARMAAVDAAMTVRLQLAGLALDVDTQAPAEPLDLEQTITGPVTLPDPPEPPYPTPAAATLQRAARRLRDGGWCRGALVDAEGARCLYGALHAEAPTARAESDALAVLLDAIRRHWPDAETVPDANDHRIGSWRVAVRLLDQAAALADTRGL